MPGNTLANSFRLLFFASAASFTRKPSEDFPTPLPVAALWGMLEERYPGMKKAVLDSCALTVNLNYVDLEEEGDQGSAMVIQDGDEVAIIPPVSSG